MCFQRFFSFRLEPVIRDILKVGAVSCIIVILSRESGALLKRFFGEWGCEAHLLGLGVISRFWLSHRLSQRDVRDCME